MEKILFQCTLAPGDIVVLTSAIRDLNLAYPDKYRCNVWGERGQLYPALLENNPFVDTTITPKTSTRIIVPHYHEEMRLSNTQRDLHFTEAITSNIAKQLGITIRSNKRPALYLTDQEKANRPQQKPYWVLMAGCKSDITTKCWSEEHWQSLVTILRDITFVQVGAANREHWNPSLRQVVNKVGQTTLRELLLYIYHAEGVVCGVTCGLHIAAAFEKPCVIIAGGREGPWWEKYPEQTYIHMIGKLPCCEVDPCWKSHIDISYAPADASDRMSKVCVNLVPKQEQSLPMCMNAITPIDVARAIKDYYGYQTENKPSSVKRSVPTAPVVSSSVSICACLYGTDHLGGNVRSKTGERMTYHETHLRCLKSIVKNTGTPFDLILGCNEVDPKTLNWIRIHLPKALVLQEKGNIHKYPMMRKMFSHVKTDWVAWFDDDSYVTEEHPNWLREILSMVARFPNRKVWGRLYTFDILKGQLQWVQNATWFRGKPAMLSGDGKRLMISFPTGGFQLIQSEVIRKLDWPDPRLDHNGGDVMFGEACHQMGFEVGALQVERYGIMISGADRRGFSQRPAGAESLEYETLDALSKGKIFYLTEQELVKMSRTGTIFILFPELMEKKEIITSRLAQIAVLEQKLADPKGCGGCGKGRTLSELRVEAGLLLKILVDFFRTMTEEKKNRLLTYVKTEYNSKAESLCCELIGRL